MGWLFIICVAVSVLALMHFPEVKLKDETRTNRVRAVLLSICLSYNSLFSRANEPDTSQPGLACQIRLIVDYGDGGQQPHIV